MNDDHSNGAAAFLRQQAQHSAEEREHFSALAAIEDQRSKDLLAEADRVAAGSAAPAPAPGDTGTPPAAPAPQFPAAIVGLPSAAPLLGFNFGGLAYATDKQPGRLHFDYEAPGDEHFAYAASVGNEAGVAVNARIGISWARLQPSIDGDFDPGYLATLKDAIARAKAHGLSVLVDNHSSGGHELAGPVSFSAFANFTARLAIAVGPDVEIEPINEPSSIDPEKWKAAGQAAIDAVRAAGATNFLWMDNGHWSGANEPTIAWTDPIKRVGRVCHVYGDRYSAGQDLTWATASSAGVTVSRLADAIGPVIAAAKQDGIALRVTEVNVGNDNPAWGEMLAGFVRACRDAAVGFDLFYMGPWLALTDPLNLNPRADGSDSSQVAAVLAALAPAKDPGTSPPPNGPTTGPVAPGGGDSGAPAGAWPDVTTAITVTTPRGEVVTLAPTIGLRQKLGASPALYATYFGFNLLVLSNSVRGVAAENASGKYLTQAGHGAPISHDVVLRSLEREPLFLDGVMPQFAISAAQVAALEAASLIPHCGVRADALTVSADQTFETDDTGDASAGAGDVSAAYAIGLLARNSLVALFKRTPEAVNACVADALEATSWATHYGDVDGAPIVLGKYPDWSTNSGTDGVEANDPHVSDCAHQPSLVHAALLIARASGCEAYARFFVEEQAFWTSFTGYWPRPEARDRGNHVLRVDGGVYQVRGALLAISHFAQALGVQPVGAFKDGIVRSLGATFDVLRRTFIDGGMRVSQRAGDGLPELAGWALDDSAVNVEGYIDVANTYDSYPGSAGIAAWQVGFAVGLPFALRGQWSGLGAKAHSDGAAVRDFLYTFVVKTLGYRSQRFGVYGFPARDLAGGWHTAEQAWAAYEKAPGLKTPTDPAVLLRHDQDVEDSDLWGSYFGGLFQLLSQAVQDKFPGAADLYKRLVSTRTFQNAKGAAGGFPNYCLMPLGCYLDDPFGDGSAVVVPAPAPLPAPPVESPPTAPSPAPVSFPVVAGPPFTREEYESLTKLHPGFRSVPEEVLAALPSSYPDGTPGEMVYNEPGPGYRPEISIRANASVLWAISMDPRARACMIANAHASKWFPIHVSAPDQPGEPLRPWLYPNKSLNSSTKPDQNALLPDPIGNRQISVDVAHQPHFLMDFVLLMQREGNAAEAAWGCNEIKYWIARNYLAGTDIERGYAKGIWNPLSSSYQARGAGWAAVWTFVGLIVLPADDEWRPWLLSQVEENILFLDGVFRVGDYDLRGPNAPDGSPGTKFSYQSFDKFAFVNDWGFLSSGGNSYGNGTDGTLQNLSGFMQAFQAQAWMWGYRLKLPIRAEVQAVFDKFIHWVGRFAVMMFGPPDDPQSWDYRRAGEYSMMVGRARADIVGGTAFFKTPGEFYAANYGTDQYKLPPDDHSFREHDQNGEVTEFAGRYVDNILPALSFAVEIGIEGAAEAFARAKGTKQYVQQGGSYAFGYLPAGEFFDMGTYGKALPAPGPAAPAPSAPAPAAPAPQPPAPAAPAPGAVWVPTGGTFLAKEGDPFTLKADTVVRYGVHLAAVFDSKPNGTRIYQPGDYFLTRMLKAGAYTGTLNNYGFPDPAFGVPKFVYAMPDGTPVDAPPAATPPAPSPGSAAPSPAPALVNPTSGMDVMTIPDRNMHLTVKLAKIAAETAPTFFDVTPEHAVDTLFNNWSSAALATDEASGTFRLVTTGGGHEASVDTPNVQGNIVTEGKIGSAVAQFFRNKPKFPSSNRLSGMHDGGMMSNGMPYNDHTYNCFAELPESWGFGPNLVFRFHKSNGGNYPVVYDATVDSEGFHVLTDKPLAFNRQGRLGGDYASIARDDNRRGFWVVQTREGINCLLVRPTRDADGKWGCTAEYYPGITGNAGMSLFFDPEDGKPTSGTLYTVAGNAFSANPREIAYLTALVPNASPATCSVYNFIPFRPQPGKPFPTSGTSWGGDYHQPKQMASDLSQNRITAPGTGYRVGDQVTLSVKGEIPLQISSGEFAVVGQVGSAAGIVVKSVDGAGGITSFEYQQVQYDGFSMPNQGAFYVIDGTAHYPSDGTGRSGYLNLGVMLPLTASGGSGTGATVSSPLEPSVSNVDTEKVGFAWVQERGAAYGWFTQPNGGEIVVKLTKPANPLAGPWLITQVECTHDPRDVTGQPSLGSSVNGNYRKGGVWWPKGQVFLRLNNSASGLQVLNVD